MSKKNQTPKAVVAEMEKALNELSDVSPEGTDEVIDSPAETGIDEITDISSRGEETTVVSAKTLKEQLADMKKKEKELKAQLKEQREKEKANKGTKATSESYTRFDSVVDIVNQSIQAGTDVSLATLAEDANKAFTAKKGTGKDNLKESKFAVNIVVKVVTGLNLVEVKDGNIHPIALIQSLPLAE